MYSATCIFTNSNPNPKLRLAVGWKEMWRLSYCL